MIKRTLRLPSLVPLFLVDVTAGPSVPVSDENDIVLPSIAHCTKTSTYV